MATPVIALKSAVCDAEDFVDGRHFGASTDMGDISHPLPALHPMIGGSGGR